MSIGNEKVSQKKVLFDLPKTVVLVGMMGVGKTSIGRRLAKTLGVAFKDSDHEVEKASGHSISDVFELYGEEAFVDVERRIIHRLMDEKPHVLSTGVGAFITPENRELIGKKGFSVFLDASVETLLPRVERRDHRPQLAQGEKEETLKRYLDAYVPVYKQADFQVNCDDQIPDKTVDLIVQELQKHF
jgi:shikimate kinase